MLSCAFMHNVLFPCKCVTFFNKAALLRQNIDDVFVKSTHEQHERMHNTFQRMQNVQLEIALMSVQYQIHIFRET